MQYWINHNGVQSGPVDVDGIKEMGLTSAAYVWHEGLTDWVKITQLPELQGMYEMLEPVAEPAVTGQPVEAQPAPAQQPQINYQQPATTEPCPPTNLVWAIITTVLCCIPSGIVAIFYALKVSNKYRFKLILKCRNDNRFREMLSRMLIAFSGEREFNGVTVYADMDPLNL
jgi:hypothetical protein